MTKAIRSYKDLQVWQEAMELVAQTYVLTAKLPESERFGLKPQMRRAAVSVPANIAEGHASNHRKVFLNHLSMARGSLTELETYVLLMMKLQYATSEHVQGTQQQIQKVGKLLNGLIRSLKAKP